MKTAALLSRRIMAMGLSACLLAEPITAAMRNEPCAMGDSKRVVRCALPVAPSDFLSQALSAHLLSNQTPGQRSDARLEKAEARAGGYLPPSDHSDLIDFERDAHEFE